MADRHRSIDELRKHSRHRRQVERLALNRHFQLSSSHKQLHYASNTRGNPVSIFAKRTKEKPPFVEIIRQIISRVQGVECKGYELGDLCEPDLTELPIEREADLLSEAVEYYLTLEPPFLQKFCQRKEPGAVTPAFLATDGQKGALGPEVALITRAWESRGVYQTLDINGQRLIVKQFVGGPRGGFYRRWMGISKDFGKPPIAFPINQKHTRRHDRAAKKKQASVEKFREPSDEEIKPSPRLSSGPFPWKEISGSLPNPVNPPKATQTRPPRPRDLPTKSKYGVKRKREGPESPAPNARIRTMETVPQPTRKKASSKAANAELPRRKHIGQYDASLPTTLPWIRGKPMPTNSSQKHAIKPAAPLLSPNKQAQTTLSVYLPPNEDYVPLRLRFCMIMSTFFDSVIQAFEMDDRPDKVAALRVALERLPEDDGSVRATWLVKRVVMDSFDIFLEAVNRWPGWMEKESCSVVVDIVMKP